MKKIFIAFLLVAMAGLPTILSARDGYGAAGCGLGAVVIAENKKVHQVIAATVNVLFSGNQVFGISTGTLNCKTAGISEKQRQQQIFVHVNYRLLEHEFARGNGERVGALASLMGCKDSTAFGRVGKEKFATLFQENTPDSFLDKMRSEVSSDARLVSSCGI
ncbi:DUF3015 domain-containing protein [Leptospira fletcheri]|uniref:DUF3015 domain-containing protein n=1 Tax=Leptospira fletcheri TaxID=2484981 RepID=A0A4R9GJ27_9LEPT|nr:DUF3015 family protein [Leptospira fletcheri]TGK13129.1 DUF3015 domain-containing protein [Leptospira fletcheri]